MRALAIAALLLAAPCTAQTLPQPGAENPRIQSVKWTPGEEVILTALPRTGLTVILEPGEQIRRVSLDNQSVLDVRVSADMDSFLILPLSERAESGMLVQTDRRDYRFGVRSDTGLTAAYLVKFDYSEAESPVGSLFPAPTGEQWTYKLRGDQSVRPEKIGDDGIRTWIQYGSEQALPAVFAIGPTGMEEVVNGYMRGDVFVIDRVYSELVFRIDKHKATARRSRSPGNSDG